MTDLKMTKLCAEAMGLDFITKAGQVWMMVLVSYSHLYDPLNDDCQAMALVKKLRLDAETIEVGYWSVTAMEHAKKHGGHVDAHSDDLNRAIVLCAARLQVESTAQETVARSVGGITHV